MDSSYVPVSSNDTLLHLALPSSPETLCGRIVVNIKANFSASDMALKCDLCDTLSGGSAFLKYTQGSDAHHHLASDHEIDLDLIPPYILEDEENLELFHREAHIIQKEAGAYISCPDCDETLGSCGDDGADVTPISKYANIDGAWESPQELIKAHKQLNCPVDGTTSSVKEAKPRNWTRDGIEIVGGFDLVVTADEARETPFLDTNRVSISSQIHCPDCDRDEWLSKVASCVDCGEFKCDGCMDSSSYDLFVGTCKKCANVSEEEENYFLNDYDDNDYSTAQRAEALFADDEELDLTFFSGFDN